jgi:hypothetical protein
MEWTGVMAQAEEHLLCQCEALSSNPSPAEKNKGMVAHASHPCYVKKINRKMSIQGRPYSKNA